MDDHGYLRKYAGRRGKVETYASRAKKAEMERSKLLASGGRSNPQQTFARPFKTPTVVKTGTKTKPTNFADKADRANSKSAPPKSVSDSESDENCPSQIHLTSDSHDQSDEEEDARHAARNDIRPTDWAAKKDGHPKSRAKETVNTSKKSSKRVDSDRSDSESESILSSSQTSAKGIKIKKPQMRAFIKPPPVADDEPARKFKIPALSTWDELEDKPKAARAKFKIASRTPTPERQSVKRKFFNPVKAEGLDDEPEQKEKERRKPLARAAIFREVGGSPNRIKNALIDAGLGQGLDQLENEDMWRSPPKKTASTNQGLSSLAARIANRRMKEEPQEIKDEEVDEIDVFTDLDQASCPMCHEVVPASLLMSFSNNRPRSLNTRQQAAFCVHHKRDAALTTYRNQGYPDVHWDSFNNRLVAHYTYISSLITSPATTPAYYRPLFASDIKHGRNRTLKQSIMGAKDEGSSTGRILTPGYYGTRGAQAIQQAIMLKFNQELRKAAVDDHVVSARAVGGYVASVLVPELGTRLIMEDMGIDEEAARKVMEESAALGSLVNDELKDVRSDTDRSIIEEGDDYD